MRGAVLSSMVGLMAVALAASALAACPCGKHACGQQCCQPACNSCGEQVQYETKTITCYKTVYEDVHEKKMVPGVKYVPDTELRDVPCTICEPAPVSACAPAAGPCAPCQAAPCCPKTCIRKVPVTVFRAVPCENEVDTVRLVQKTIPYTVTVYCPLPTPPQPCAPAAACK
jgi:hypothetical protein